MNPRMKKLVDKASHVRSRMWDTHPRNQRKSVLWAYATLRVLTITWLGLKENRIVNRAAALSFSTLLGLGPLVAISVLISGIVLKNTDPDLAANTIYQAIDFITPQADITTGDGSPLSTQGESQPSQNDEIKGLVQQFIESSQSGTVGIFGTIGLILIVIQLFATIEDAFNDIWGVHRGRSWVTRIVLYWTILSLGTVLVFATIALFGSQQKQIQSLSNNIPSQVIIDSIALYGPRAATLALVVGLLAAFYRFIPNTIVNWKSSLIGAFFALCCLMGNNALAFLYVKGVARQRSLYGSVSILPVLMLGLFVFWVIILLGGRLTYAVQNARFRGNKIAWDELSLLSQESICLLVFTKLCRRFKSCEKPIETQEIAEQTNLPTQIINAGLSKLSQIGLASPIENKKGSPFQSTTYQPALPLNKVTLRDFKKRLESHGNTPDKGYFRRFDPSIRYYRKQIDESLKTAFGDKTFEEILEDPEAIDPSPR